MTLRLAVDDYQGYRKDCQESFARFGNTTDALTARRIGFSCALSPQGVEDVADILPYTTRVLSHETPSDWYGVTLGLTEYRDGGFTQALNILARAPSSTGFEGISALAVQAMAQQKLKQNDAPYHSLEQARRMYARSAGPGPGLRQDNWHPWLNCTILLREAEVLVPAPVFSKGPAEATNDDALLDRKARAERLSIQMALALIRRNGGEKEEAEAELRTVFAERAKLAAEEPANEDYQADVVATRQQIAQSLVEAGKIDEGMQELQRASADLAKLNGALPRVQRIRQDQGVVYLALGKAGRPKEAVHALKTALALLNAARKEDPKKANLQLAAAQAQYRLGELYAGYGLLI